MTSAGLTFVHIVNRIYIDMGSLKRKHLDLFSGIGGFALAARWAGIETIGFCEIDKYAQKVLQKNFPGVPIYEDVTKLNGSEFKDIYLLTGGFPCQDISIAGKGAGIEGERSGLWSELFRIIGEVRPRYALIENVPALTFRGGTRVIGDLAEIGYDTEWQIVGADDVGAPHRRKRIWIVAYPKCNSQRTTHRSDSGIGGRGWNEQSISEGDQVWCNSGDSSENVADSMCINRGSREKPRQPKRNSSRKPACYSREDVAHSQSNDNIKQDGKTDTERKDVSRWQAAIRPELTGCSEDVAYSKSKRVEGCGTGGEQESHTHGQEGLPLCEGERPGAAEGSIRSSIRGMVDGIPEGLHKDVMWQKEPEDINRVSMGVKDRSQRLKGLGNSICPQVAYEIIRCLK